MTKFKVFVFTEMAEGQHMLDRWVRDNPSIYDVTTQLTSNKWNICILVSYKEK